MKYLPFEDFEIHTPLTSDEVFYRLCAAVDTKRKWWIFTNKPFWGEVDRRDFRIWRTTWWNRNFTPVVSGKIWSEGSGCCILVRMRMPWHSFLFYSLVLGWLLVIYFGGIVNLLIQKLLTGVWQIESPWLLLPGIGMFAFGYLISVGTFKRDVRYIRDYLLSLLQTGVGNIIYQDEFLGLTETQIIKAWFVITLFISLVWVLLDLVR